jgi:hypothetical protein
VRALSCVPGGARVGKVLHQKQIKLIAVQAVGLLDQGESTRALGHLAGGLVRLDGGLRGVVTIGGVPQEDHVEHRHGVLAGGQLGVGPELVCGHLRPDRNFLKFQLLPS